MSDALKAVNKFFKDLKQKVPPHINKLFEEIKDCKYEIVVLGNTKAGKSTLLNEIMSHNVELNTGASRETCFRWRISFSTKYKNISVEKVFKNEETKLEEASKSEDINKDDLN